MTSLVTRRFQTSEPSCLCFHEVQLEGKCAKYCESYGCTIRIVTKKKRCPTQSSNFYSVIKSSFIPTVFSQEPTLSFCGSKNTFYKMYF
ncbi:hypothetical protein TNIN_286221 [Trichonephila inaurata madagascariensis]|uniref:Uncharacterized protein n=1 Tax=Trichonephila inaurata madagascariensis TaxID=2747483 RepID=A0A8X7C3R1_9ARAC|nr:hypothetical protein TNIN_286221 [Trichonephila inaurata madagascariensis]